MNNEVLEKIEEYNNGGLLNEPITFSNNANSIDSTTLLSLLASNITSGFGPLSFPKEKTVRLTAELVADSKSVRKNPEDMENYIRYELALKLAQQLIDEDLIQIQSCEDIETMNTHFRATVKVIQE